jgi:SAM-dependent methyltransferase
MSGFSTDWLALREPFDRAARQAAADAFDWPAFAAWLHARHGPGDALNVVDLGCGTGASLRAVALRLGGRQRWRMFDHDPALLAAVPDALAAWAQAEGLQVAADGSITGRGLHLQVQCCRADLAAGLADLPLQGAALVTASALMDLVSARWLQALVAHCHASGAAVCWALNVDDRVDWHPLDADDARVHAAFRAHQQRDKGFGPALGGAAAACAADALRAAGYAVQLGPSDWQIGPHDAAMLRAMVQGIGDAAIEQAPADAARVQAWQARRLAPGATAQLRVGHVDLWAWPADGAA